MTCDKCKYFHILYEPLRTTGELWDMGRAKCDKRNLITDFANHGKFKRLDTCENFEPQESEEQMTRAEAIKVFTSLLEVRRKYCDMQTMRNEIEAIEMAIEALSRSENPNRWIPVGERLPEVGSEVLVCFDFKGKRSVYISEFYGDGEFHGFDDEYLTSEGRKYRKAVAWMSLPEPYKAERSEEE